MILNNDFLDKYKSILEPDEKEVKNTKNKYYEAMPNSLLFIGDSLFYK